MKLLFEQKIIESAGTATFIFAPVEPAEWIAGQSIKLEVPGAYGPLEHRFTISSAPYEQKIAVTTRLSSSSYKKSLFSLQPGDQVNAFAIEGTFTWRESAMSRIFVAAGIGITPFHSILKERVHHCQPIPATLVYSSSTNDIIFKDELDKWAVAHPELKIHYLIGERVHAGHIAAAADPTHSLIYLSGPSSMVDELSAALISQGAPESNLVRDWFTGRLPQLG